MHKQCFLNRSTPHQCKMNYFNAQELLLPFTLQEVFSPCRFSVYRTNNIGLIQFNEGMPGALEALRLAVSAMKTRLSNAKGCYFM